ncbi:MAG: hypothetical protein IPG02_05585 [Ignavibacteria bacterium]|nr:hypothetical protein [Ignavibacteria bacterium]
MLMIILFVFTTICGNTVANDGAGSKSIFNYNDLPFDSTETDAIQERFLRAQMQMTTSANPYLLPEM